MRLPCLVKSFPLIDVSNALPDLAAIASDASVAVVALPVTLPVKGPLNDVAVATPVTTASARKSHGTSVFFVYNVIYL